MDVLLRKSRDKSQVDLAFEPGTPLKTDA